MKVRVLTALFALGALACAQAAFSQPAAREAFGEEEPCVEGLEHSILSRSPRPLTGHGHARHGKHIAADARLEINAQRWLGAKIAQSPGDCKTVALKHLGLGGERKAYAAVQHEFELRVGQVVAVHISSRMRWPSNSQVLAISLT